MALIIAGNHSEDRRRVTHSTRGPRTFFPRSQGKRHYPRIDPYTYFVHKCKIAAISKSKMFAQLGDNTPHPRHSLSLLSRGPWVVPRCQVSRSWEITITPAPLPPIEDDQAWEPPPGQPPPSGIRPRSHHSYFIHMFYLTCIMIVLLACSKAQLQNKKCLKNKY